MSQVRVALPVHLQTLANVGGEVCVDMVEVPTPNTVLDALEARYPMLRGTIREHGSLKRRAFIRYFADGRDISHESADEPLPRPVAAGSDAFCVIGAISGG
ncbi:MAG TPA: MoaD/ThiS family protein [Longimicrobiaceae bacterium]|nr:MoaD/ThiS family protein [Longimicrobiaceae bacterium]